MQKRSRSPRLPQARFTHPARLYSKPAAAMPVSSGRAWLSLLLHMQRASHMHTKARVASQNCKMSVQLVEFSIQYIVIAGILPVLPCSCPVTRLKSPSLLVLTLSACRGPCSNSNLKRCQAPASTCDIHRWLAISGDISTHDSSGWLLALPSAHARLASLQQHPHACHVILIRPM